MGFEDWAWLLPSAVGFEFERDSRWHPRHKGFIRSVDRIGDHLIYRAWSGAEHLEVSVAGDEGAAEAYLDVAVAFVEPILAYDREPRALVKLAHTGHAVELVERFHRWVDTASPLSKCADNVDAWQSQLWQERMDRLQFYEAMMASDDAFRVQVQQDLLMTEGDEHEYFLEVLTLLKHGLRVHSQRLLPAENELLLAVYDRLSMLSGTVIMTIPTWFASSLELHGREFNHTWRGAGVSVQYPPANGESEEAFVTQLALWTAVNHPHIAKVFAASHVGRRFVIHKRGSSTTYDLMTHWYTPYQCVLGLEHLHLCGLAYRGFDRDCIISWSPKVVLLARDIARQDDQGQSLATNLCRLARIVFESITSARQARANAAGQFHSAVLSAPEVAVLNAMHSFDTEDQFAVSKILQQLRALINSTGGSFHFMPSDELRTEAVARQQPAGPDQQLRSLALVADRSFARAFDELAERFGGREDATHAIDRQVYQRLLNLYEQLGGRHSLPSELVMHFRNVAARFYRSTEASSVLSWKSQLSESCAERTLAGRSYSYHHEIDRLLSFSGVDSTSSVHEWPGRWKSNRSNAFKHGRPGLSTLRDHGDNALAGIAETAEEAEDEEGVDWSQEYVEAAVVAQFEATRRRGAYSPPELRALQSAQQRITRGVGSVAVPEWFIPYYEVELGDFIAQGSFGAVYRAKWFETTVVVKTLLRVDSAEQRQAFVREAEIWFMLNHPNVVKLFGACHVGRQPFFVCEWAGGGTLPEVIAGRRRLAPTIDGAWQLSYAWDQLCQAAIGLQCLHEQGIVHGDLKGNNILVGSDTVKLTDFGLSRFQRLDGDELDVENSGALGAYRWKAPEVLSGGPSTFASDVYSFAMCIIEVVTGEYPWGKSLEDAEVKVLVKKEGQPALPDTQWWCGYETHLQLTQRMMSFDPSNRPSIAAVVEALQDWESRSPT